MENKLKELRKGKKLSQEELGKLLDVSRQTIISIEKGKYYPSLPLAFKLGKVLGVKIEDIFSP
jgi:putative transcriptional regulator